MTPRGQEILRPSHRQDSRHSCSRREFDQHAHTLTGLSSPPAFGENTVNAAPQRIDPDVTFTGTGVGYNGGVLTVSGLRGEDRLGVRNEGADAGQIGVSGAAVSFGGQVIGSLAGGAGSTLTITFNASATTGAIEALIENLTYSNVSDTPTASRTLLLNVTDAAGTGLLGATTFSRVFGAADPFNGMDLGDYPAPTFADLDSDGDADLIVGRVDGTLEVLRNGADGGRGAFTALPNGANPFDGINVGAASTPSLTDLDGDGDLDLLLGNATGTLEVFRNGGEGTAGAFTQLAGAANPFDGIDVGDLSAATMADLDGDGDSDLIVGSDALSLAFYRNGAVGTSGPFSLQTGADNPLDGLVGGPWGRPVFADLDNDGDLDLIVGNEAGALSVFRNGGVGSAGAYSKAPDSENPFAAVDVGFTSAPAFGDVDGDGDLDLVVGNQDGPLWTYLNTTGQRITVTVNAENDAPTGAGLPADVTAQENVASNLDLSAVTIADADTFTAITLTLTAASGTMTAASGGVTVTGSNSGTLVLNGTAWAVDTFLNTASNIQYTGAPNLSGANAATLTVTANDGSGAVTLGTVNVDITAAPPPSPPEPAGPSAAGDDISLGDGGGTVFGLAGDDQLAGGSGADLVHGNTGADSLSGGAGSDIVRGGRDNDVVQGNTGHDLMFGDRGDDVVHGGQGNDLVQGNAGADIVFGDLGEDTVRGGQGDDLVFGGAGGDFLSGDLGADTLTGGEGADLFYMFAGAGRDVLTDFNPAQGDRLLLDPGATYAVAQVGADTVLTLGDGSQVVLLGFQGDAAGANSIIGV